MAAAHHAAQHSRYSLPAPPNVYDDRRLPSLKDLNFQYRPPVSQENNIPGNGLVVDPASAGQEHAPRHSQPWSRASAHSPVVPIQQHQHQQHHQQQQQHYQHHPQQQHTPPLSNGHDISAPKPVDYAPKHDGGGYLTPGIPLSAQITPVPGSLSTGTRGDDAQKRARTNSATSISIPREGRPIHVRSRSCHLRSYDF